LPDPKDKEIERRSFWSGTLTFGLVSVPVALFPGNRMDRPALRMLAPDGTPLQRRYYCPQENRPLANEEIVRGYEMENGKYVVVSDEELESLEPKKSREIDLRLFVPRQQIDPVYFDRAYFLVPTGDSAKAYRLLAEIMEKTDRAGVATFIMRGKEYLVAILSEKGILRAETLRFAQEIRNPRDIGLPEPQPVPETAVKVMDKEIQRALVDRFDFDALKDEVEEKKWALIERKKKAGIGIIHPPEEAEEEEEKGAEVIDLMAVLKKRLAGRGAPESGKTKRPAVRKK
jgi:DNA end-binding protein Ku